MSDLPDDLVAECMHLDSAGEVCPGCSEPVDEYGNTESVFKYCSYPNCGCDGARLCMAGEASELACSSNVEGMWSGKTPEHVKGVFELMNHLSEKRTK